MATKRKTTERGYGRRHQALRERLKPLVEAGGAVCARCGKPILPGEPWDLGHVDGSRTEYHGAEHAYCNRSAANRRRPDPRRHGWRSPSGIPTSRQWGADFITEDEWQRRRA